MALGLAQFTLYVHAENVVIAAAQDAARIAAAEGNHIDGARQRGQQIVQAGLGTSVSATVEVSEVPQNNPDRVVVSVTAQQRLIVPWFKPNIRLAAKTEMTKERFRAQQ